MSVFVPNNRWEFVAVGVLIGVLTLLGVLQYRWLGEIREAERERQQKNLNVAANNLTNEFDREITRIFVQLQINPNSKKLPENYDTRYERWQSTTLYPKIVSRIFFAFKDERSEIKLAVYEPAAQRFEASDWTAPLVGVRQKIERNLDNLTTTAADISDADDKTNNDLILIPAVTVDLSNLDLNQTAPMNKTFAAQRIRRIGYTIVLLDGDYLRNELLPSLVVRYFPKLSDAEDYKIFVKERSGEKIIYQSGSFSKLDAEKILERDFFRIKLAEIGSVMPNSARDTKNSSAAVLNNRISTGIVIAPGGQPQFSASPDQESNASLIGGFEPRWQLIAEDGDDSLDSIIWKTRWRNTLVSGAILLLLGASGAWLLVLSNRSRVFARRQKDFVASVSHELRTPLAVIRSLSENLADGIVQGENQVKEYGAVINDEEHRLSAMVEQMLGFAAAQNSLPAVEKTPQSVREIIEIAVADYRRELENGNFVVEKIVASNLPFVAGDFDSLRRAVGNLIGNAVKYSGDAHKITVAAKTIDNGKFVEISVKDCGAGISSQDLPDIFKLFYRAKSAVDGQVKGSGIGLNLVKQIVEAHGGTISAVSELDRGSIFTIKLPALTEDSFVENVEV